MLSLFVAQLNKNLSGDNTFAGDGFKAWREQFKSTQGTKRDKKQWRKVKPMQPVWLFILSCRPFEETFENT